MDSLSKFQSLLNEIFQFEASDLDFGIYRILNYKRDQIDKFIKEDIKNIVENAFSKHRDERLLNVTQKFEDARKRVIETLGEIAFTPTRDLKAEFQNTPVGKDYLLLKEQKDLAGKIDEIKLQVFNDLYTFFSRYYEEGDFVPQYRYSIKNFRYAIPYNGEEVKLYWANEGQYYTKTGILFRDYAFFSDPRKTYKVIFRTVSAREELASNKATKARFFVLDDENNPLTPPFSKGGQGGFPDEKTLIIRFQYRELTDKEVRLYDVEGGSNTAKQEKINQKISDEIIKQIKDSTLKAFLSSEYKNEKTLLLYQISRFTSKNTKDYFIHKNLRKFLTEQLDYFIKAEVLSIETLENEPFLDKHITRAKVVREVGEKIIDFLSQIEDFQKKLWEKKKFVLQTNYVITTDRVPEEFYDEVLKNKAQLEEWGELGFEIATPSARNEKKKAKKGVIARSKPTKQSLRNLKLPVDTKHFSEEFKERLLEKLTENADLDDLLDGFLIKSENYQALNLLMNKFKGKIKCIYIDPPYNTGSDEFLYRDRYQDSSWISMMENRLILAKESMREDGVIFVSIDDNEFSQLQIVLKNVFGVENFKNSIIVSRGIKNVQAQFETVDALNIGHEYILTFGKKIKTRFPKILIGEARELGSWNNHWRGTDRPTMRYKLFGITPERGQWRWSKERSLKAIENYKQLVRDLGGNEDEITQEVIDDWWLKKFKNTGERVDLLRLSNTGKPEHYVPPSEGTLLSDLWEDIQSSHSKELASLFGVLDYPNPKSTKLMKRVIEVGCLKNSIMMDFFGGSGTTVHSIMTLNNEDGGNRKYILVEMANYFETIIIPRIKKIAYSYNWKEGKPQDNDGIATFFKYQILEQYEDALDNLELKPNKAAQNLFKDDYLLKYFLEFETQDSPNLLDIEHLKDPFSYKLKVNFEEMGEPAEALVDIPETFNYLLGLKVKKIKARQNLKNKYLFILGEKEGSNIAVVWRKVDDNWDEDDFKKDKEFIIKELKVWMPQRIYINGQSILTTSLEEHPVEIHYIEPEFKALMFS